MMSPRPSPAPTRLPSILETVQASPTIVAAARRGAVRPASRDVAVPIRPEHGYRTGRPVRAAQPRESPRAVGRCPYVKVRDVRPILRNRERRAQGTIEEIGS